MKTISQFRLNELVDYATNYGEVDETWPNGKIASNGNAMSDLWRDNICALKELRRLRHINRRAA